METDIEFEAVFICGVKITIHRENVKMDDPLKIKIINSNDKSESLLDYDRIAAPNISAIEHFSPEIRQMIDNAITVKRTIEENKMKIDFIFRSFINFVYREIRCFKNGKKNYLYFDHFQLNSVNDTLNSI